MSAVRISARRNPEKAIETYYDRMHNDMKTYGYVYDANTHTICNKPAKLVELDIPSTHLKSIRWGLNSKVALYNGINDSLITATTELKGALDWLYEREDFEVVGLDFEAHDYDGVKIINAVSVASVHGQALIWYGTEVMRSLFFMLGAMHSKRM
jgi:hypothetical protein